MIFKRAPYHVIRPIIAIPRVCPSGREILKKTKRFPFNGLRPKLTNKREHTHSLS